LLSDLCSKRSGKFVKGGHVARVELKVKDVDVFFEMRHRVGRGRKGSAFLHQPPERDLRETQSKTGEGELE